MLAGKTSKGKIIERLSDGKTYHDKAIRTQYKGKLKPFAERLKKKSQIFTFMGFPLKKSCMVQIDQIQQLTNF